MKKAIKQLGVFITTGFILLFNLSAHANTVLGVTATYSCNTVVENTVIIKHHSTLVAAVTETKISSYSATKHLSVSPSLKEENNDKLNNSIGSMSYIISRSIYMV